MLYPLRWFIIISVLTVIGSCSSAPESEFYETEGIISIKAVHADYGNNWESFQHFISQPLQLIHSGRSDISFRFYVQSPGLYSLWILSAMAENLLPEKEILITVTDDSGLIQFAGTMVPENSKSLTWNPLDYNSAVVEFEQPGFYDVLFEFNDHSGFLFEKLHLTKNNAYPPSGFGFPETAEPDSDPILTKRQQPVMIPPAWAFGLMVWADENQNDVVDLFLNRDIMVDAVLDLRDEDKPQPYIPAPWMDQKNIFSANIIENSGEEFISKDLSTSGSRLFMLSGMQNLSNPNFKKLPAKRADFIARGLSEKTISEVLRQQIEMISNPRHATYEAPFLSAGVNDIWMTDNEEQVSDELLVRWVQFSSLMGLMHIYVPQKVGGELFAAQVIDEIRKMTNLRSRLFPYLYSLAHLVRARAENPARGDGEHTLQYRLGEAFLVAPVYREGEDSRAVWFPEGTWYNYWSGEPFEGGQTWLVDATVNEIPLFVKAGSIIPYRSRAGQIMAGSNSDLAIEIYTGGVGTFRLYEDDGVTNRYRMGELATTGFRYFETDEYATFTIGRTVGEYEGQFLERSLELMFLHIPEPDQVIANSNLLQKGSETGEWMYSKEKQKLTIQWNQKIDFKTDIEIRF